MIAQCSCGAVRLDATGAPIASVLCYCDDCQEGSRRAEALPGAGPVRDPDGGTAYLVYRKDRVRMAAGAELLQDSRIVATSATSRVIASCCHSVMMMRFDDARHWVSIYRGRFQGDVPPVEMRVCTRFRAGGPDLPGDVPSHAGFPARFLARLFVARIAMLVRQ